SCPVAACHPQAQSRAPAGARCRGSPGIVMSDTLMVGVSGIRGLVDKDLTPDIVARYAAAFGRWALAHGKRVVVGRDSRQSGPAFVRACIAGLNAVGCDVVDVGVVPTPTVQLAVTHHRAAGGIAVTASHNPIEWNALKFIGPDSIFLDGADGGRVLELVQANSAQEKAGAGTVAPDSSAAERHVQGVLRLPVVDVN